MSRGRVGSLLAAIALVVVAIFGALNIERIQDVISYYQYSPSESVASFADKSGMSDRGRFLFYASQPSLKGVDTFSKYCKAREKDTHILGCYDGRNIYIYDINDPRLVGVGPTTAAHEMLHAAYQRLSEGDRKMVNALLEAEYEKLKDDERLAERMAFYARTQPGERGNELHSIIGTEVDGIGGELEGYYQRYFSDRSKVVAQHQQYFSVFEELQGRRDSLSKQIDELQAKIADKRASYSAQSQALQRDINEFERRIQEGGFDSEAQFYSQRQLLLSRSAGVESLRVSLNNDVTKNNQLVKELDAVAIEANNLNRSLDSAAEPAPSL